MNTSPLTLGRAMATAWPRPEFILGPLQPGDVGLVSGADGSGKTWVAMTAGLAVSKGRASVCGGIWDVPHGVTGRVLYVAIEDREADHGRRLQAIVQHCLAAREIGPVDEDDDTLTVWPLQGKRMPLVRPVQGSKGGGERYEVTAQGEAFAREIADCRLVILDPLRAFHDLDESDGAGMDFLIRWLVSVAMINQQAILLVHHASQGAILDRRDDHHAGRGATDLPAGCRGVWTLRAASPTEITDEDARRQWRVLVNGKASHGAESGKRLMRRSETGVMFCDTPPDEISGSESKPKPKPKTERNAYAEAKAGGRVAVMGGKNEEW